MENFTDYMNDCIDTNEPIFDHFDIEEQQIGNWFDLGKVIEFQRTHDLQIIRGEDLQYGCYIDGSMYATGLTPLGALVYGIKIFESNESRRNN